MKWMLVVVAAVLLVPVLAPALAEDDAENCEDYPLFTRMPNTFIAACEQSQFDLRKYPTGPPKGDENMTKGVDVEGPWWYLHYQLNVGATPPSGLQIMRNFENAAKKAGGTIEGSYPGWCKANYDTEFMPNMGNSCTSWGLTMKFVTAKKEVWAFLQSGENDGNYYLTISEREAMKQDIAVTEMADRLAKDGFVSLYVNFDTGKATIKPDSNQVLDDAAAVLKTAADLKIEVGGHTDNVGTPEANMKLSQDRAQAVMAALVQRGIAAARLTAKGYGQTMPVADNRTEEGRAKNRRVELVKK